MAQIQARSAYYPHQRVQQDPGGDSRTKQAFREETDINNIMRKHEKGLLIDHVNVHQGDYGNYIDAPDYHTALNRLHDADAAFMTIPAEIRAKFYNDPAEFLAFAQDPDNLDEMREMGLAPQERSEARTEPEPKEGEKPPKATEGEPPLPLEPE